MTPIITLTMNPSLDLSAEADQVLAEQKNRCHTVRLDPGGGGINVSRVVRILGGDSLAIYPAGGPAAAMLRDLLARDGVARDTVPIGGATRQDFSVLDRSLGQEYRFVLPGPEISAAEWQACLDKVEGHGKVGGTIVASGSLPPGVPDDFYARLARITKGQGVRLALDTSGAPLAAALEEGVDVVKPNLRELQDLIGEPLDGPARQDAVMHRLRADGKAGMVALTLGSGGAAAVWDGGQARIGVPPIAGLKSAVGAGDSFLGALGLALTRGRTVEDALRYAVAAGSAALLTPGTELCRRKDVERLVGMLEDAI